jgi:hypothetical protein
MRNAGREVRRLRLVVAIHLGWQQQAPLPANFTLQTLQS